MQRFLLVVLCLTAPLCHCDDGIRKHQFLHGNGAGLETPRSLGFVPFQCVNDLYLCRDGFTLTMGLGVDQGHPRIPHQYLLSSGGEVASSDGFYVRRNFGQELEIGVGFVDKLWSSKFLPPPNETSYILFTWSANGGLKVYLDGLSVKDTKVLPRVYTKPKFDQFRSLMVGKSNSDRKSKSLPAVAVFNVTHWNKAFPGETALHKTNGISEKFRLGCAPNFPTTKLKPMNTGGGDGSAATICRQRCAKELKQTSIVKGQTCICMESIQTVAREVSMREACSDGAWHIYRTFETIRPTRPDPELNVRMEQLVKDTVVRPFDTLIFHLSITTKDIVVYHVDFGDGTKKTTISSQVSHFWQKQGTYTVKVNVTGYGFSSIKSMQVKITEVDIGTPPVVVRLQAGKSADSRTVQLFTTVAGIGPMDCVLDFNNGAPKRYPGLRNYVSAFNITHTFQKVGFYDVNFNCKNKYGEVGDKVTVVSVNEHMEEATFPSHKNLVLGMHHGNREGVKVRLDGNEIQAFVNDSWMIITPNMVPHTGRHFMEVVSGDFTLYRQIFIIQEPIRGLHITPRVEHTELDVAVNLTFEVEHGDHLFVHLNYGDGREEHFFFRYPPRPLTIPKSLNYKTYGLHHLSVEVGNEINFERVTALVSVERPITFAKMKGHNVTFLDQQIAFEFEIDPGITPSHAVDVEMDYGNNVIERVRLDPVDGYVRFHNYTYPDYGIYRVRARVFNNISSIETSTLVHIGENITMVDATTPRERVSTTEDVVVAVYCPFGSPVTFVLDYDDGTVDEFTYHGHLGLVNKDGQVVTSKYAPYFPTVEPDNLIEKPTPPPVTSSAPLLDRRKRNAGFDLQSNFTFTEGGETLTNSSVQSNENITDRASMENITNGKEVTSAAPSTTVLLTTVAPEPPKDPTNGIHFFSHRYLESGNYGIKVTVKNKLSSRSTWLCPKITAVDTRNKAACSGVKVQSVNESDIENPITVVRSLPFTLEATEKLGCRETVHTRFSWRTRKLSERWGWRPELQLCESQLQTGTMTVPARTLWYGLYKITVTMNINIDHVVFRRKRSIADLNDMVDPNTTVSSEVYRTESYYNDTEETTKAPVVSTTEIEEDLTVPTLLGSSNVYYIKVIPSNLVAKLKGKEKEDLAKWELVRINFNESGDPDVSHTNRSGLYFHLVCYPESKENDVEDKSTRQVLSGSDMLGQNAAGTTKLYDYGGCFLEKKKINVTDWRAAFLASHLMMNDTLIFKLIVQKDTREASAIKKIRIWSTNITGDALDNIDALLASGDTSAALLVIDMAAGSLNSDSTNNDTEAKKQRTEMRKKLINALDGCSKQIQDFDQLSKTTDMLSLVTSSKDEVTDDSKKTAASALKNTANTADEFKDAPKERITGMASSVLGTAGNILPFQQPGQAPEAGKPKKKKRKKRAAKNKSGSTNAATNPEEEEKEKTEEEEQEEEEEKMTPKMGGIGEDEEEEEEVEEEPTCCEIYEGFCTWIEPESEELEEDERKSMEWTDQDCESEHPDDLAEYMERYNAWKAAKQAAEDALKQETTGNALGALDSVGDIILDKTEDGGSIDISSSGPMKMNFTKISPAEEGQGSNLGNFKVPGGTVAGGAGAKMMDSPNPFTWDKGAPGIKNVVSLSFSKGGKNLKVENLKEPIELTLAGVVPPMVNHTILTDQEEKMNYHPVSVNKSSSIRVMLYPHDPTDKFGLFIQYQGFPNDTHYLYKDMIPRSDLPSMQEDSDHAEEYRLTFAPPQYLTAENGTYRIGVKLLETTVNFEGQGMDKNHTYGLRIQSTACRFYNETTKTFDSAGCQVGNMTTMDKTICLCNHLTSFGGDIVVPPNTIDFNTVWAKFKDLNENAAVFSTVICVLGVYLILLFWARHHDKKDLIKWGATPLEDNLPSDNYHYQVTVQTGVGKNKGTRSKVSFVISGDDSDTGVRNLDDGKRKELPSGSIYNYLLSTESCLGQLTYLRIWHDNSGKGKLKGWFLDQVEVTDLQTGDRFFFLCNQWLDVVEGDGMVERILPVAGLNDLIAFKQLFSSSVRKKLTNEHLWFSVLSRPTRSHFTRVQRISCCVSLLFLTMITNCMFFKADEKVENVSALSIGPFSFTLHQLYISVVTTAIVFPPNLILVTIFRKARPKKNTVMQTNMRLTAKSRKFKWRSLNADSGLFATPQQKSKAQKFKESLGGILSSHRGHKYETENSIAQELASGRKKKKRWSLPHWSIYIAWILCFFSVVTSAFFTILYSMEWGKDKSNEWLSTFLLSFFQSVVVVQPVKVLLLAAFISCILRKPDLDEEEETFDDVMGSNPNAANDLLKEKNVQEVLMRRKMAAAQIRPPDLDALAESRELRMKEMQMEGILKECIIYFFFLIILFFLSYQNRDPDSFPFAENIKNNFFGSFSVSTPPTYWSWMYGSLLPTLYASNWYNGKRLDWREALQISDRNTIRVGVARLRQLRIEDDSCDVHKIFRSIVHHCRGDYNWVDDDIEPYLPGWQKPPEYNVSEMEKSKSPWVYRNSLKLKSTPYLGTVNTYKGGGYAISFARNLQKTMRKLKKLEENEWVDVRTRGLVLEFTLYNANINLFASVVMLAEFLATGSAITRTEVKVFRLQSYVGGFGIVVIIFEVAYGCFTLFFLIKEANRLRKERLKYFKEFWSLIEFSVLVLSVTAVVMYAMKKVFGTVAINALHESGSGDFVNFVTISVWDEAYTLVVGLVVFMSTVKFIKLLKFNKRMGMLGDTIRLASKDLKYFTLTFLIYFAGFCQMAYVLFGQLLPSYGSFVGTVESLFAFALGSFDFYEFQDANRVLGPLFFFLFVAIVYVGLMGMFMTILYDAFAEVKSNVELRSNDYEIVDFMMKKFKGVFGWS